MCKNSILLYFIFISVLFCFQFFCVCVCVCVCFLLFCFVFLGGCFVLFCVFCFVWSDLVLFCFILSCFLFVFLFCVCVWWWWCFFKFWFVSPVQTDRFCLHKILLARCHSDKLICCQTWRGIASKSAVLLCLSLGLGKDVSTSVVWKLLLAWVSLLLSLLAISQESSKPSTPYLITRLTKT